MPLNVDGLRHLATLQVDHAHRNELYSPHCRWDDAYGEGRRCRERYDGITGYDHPSANVFCTVPDPSANYSDVEYPSIFIDVDKCKAGWEWRLDQDISGDAVSNNGCMITIWIVLTNDKLSWFLTLERWLLGTINCDL